MKRLEGGLDAVEDEFAKEEGFLNSPKCFGISDLTSNGALIP